MGRRKSAAYTVVCEHFEDAQKWDDLADAVVVGTGFSGLSAAIAANLEWVVLLDPRLAHTGTSNHRGATGECIKLAHDIGADTLHMDYIQAIPIGRARPPFKGMFFQIESEEVRKASRSIPYRLFVNRDGKRFVNEGVDVTR